MDQKEKNTGENLSPLPNHEAKVSMETVTAEKTKSQTESKDKVKVTEVETKDDSKAELPNTGEKSNKIMAMFASIIATVTFGAYKLSTERRQNQ